MSELGEIFSEARVASRGRKARNHTHAIRMLTACGVPFTRHNNEAHFRVTLPDGEVIDYWPATGLYRRGQDPPVRGGIAAVLRLAAQP